MQKIKFTALRDHRTGKPPVMYRPKGYTRAKEQAIRKMARASGKRLIKALGK